MSFSNPLDVSLLTAAQGIQYAGAAAYDRAGGSVASAGDVNGDGLADLLVGAYNAEGGGAADRGVAYLVFGRTSGLASLDFASLGTAGFRLLGAAANDWTAYSVGTAGDINGDGFADMVIGANFADANGRVDSGSAYVVFGGARLGADINLGNLGTSGFRIDGALAGDWAGGSVRTAGDVNGDGFADLLVSARKADANGRTDSGSVYLLFGKAGGFGPVDLASLGTAGIRIDGAAAGDALGLSVDSAGDVNGDGYADMLLSAVSADSGGRINNGAAYVIFGRPSGFANIDLASLGTQGFRIDGAASADSLGIAVAGAGDVNGDGFGDILLGADGADNNGRSFSGSAYVVFGKASAFATVDLASLGTQGFRIDGAAASDGLGRSVGAAGDVNGDGFADVVVGAAFADAAGRADAGAAYVILGKASGFATIDVGAIGTAGFVIQGPAAGGGFGNGVAGIDGNADGFTDIAVGADLFTAGGRASSGAAWTLFSQSTGNANLRGTSLADSLSGGAGADTLRGGAGADLLQGRGGNDTLDGQGGNDTVTYVHAVGGVSVSLALQNQAQNVGGGAGFDTLQNIENLRGSAFGDALVGNAAANRLWGDAGNDLLTGGVGNDGLDGGAGVDAARFNAARALYTITKAAGAGWTVTSLAEGTDTLLSIERLVFDDTSLRLGPARHEDLGGRGYGDMLWMSDAGGFVYRWAMEGAARVGEGAVGGPGTGWSLAAKADLDGDFRTDLIWQHTDGRLYAWLMNGPEVVAQGQIAQLAAGQALAGAGDTDGDGKADLVLRGADGSWAVQRMNGLAAAGSAGGTLDSAWQVAAVADLDGDGRADLVWRNAASGELYGWLMDGSSATASASLGNPGTAWSVAAAADLTGDGRADLVFRNGATGQIYGWVTGTSGLAVASQGHIGFDGNGWALARVADYSGDDKADLLFTYAGQGFAWMWQMDGLTIATQGGAGVAGPGWSLL